MQLLLWLTALKAAICGLGHCCQLSALMPSLHDSSVAVCVLSWGADPHCCCLCPSGVAQLAEVLHGMPHLTALAIEGSLLDAEEDWLRAMAGLMQHGRCAARRCINSCLGKLP